MNLSYYVFKVDNTRARRFLKGNEIISNIYSIVYLDYIVVNVRQNKHIISMAIYLTLGVELDGKRVSDAIKMAYPSAHIQLCIVQMVCYSMKCVPQIDKKTVVLDLEPICGADKFEIAEASLNNPKGCGTVSTHRWLSLGVITGSV